jgi:hypothetical protein
MNITSVRTFISTAGLVQGCSLSGLTSVQAADKADSVKLQGLRGGHAVSQGQPPAPSNRNATMP